MEMNDFSIDLSPFIDEKRESSYNKCNVLVL